MTLKGRIVRTFFHPMATRLGYRIGGNGRGHQSRKDELLHHALDLFRKAGLDPRHIVDIGANHGTWTRLAMEIFPNAHFTMVEPQEWLRPSFEDLLAGGRATFHPKGVGRESGSFRFTVADRDDSSTFRLTAEEARLRGLKQVEVPVVTLDDLVAEQDLPVPDLVKIDAEGLDLEVLEGARGLFGRTEVFLCEAAVMNRAFANNVPAVVTFMDQNGYGLFDITDMNRPFISGALWLVELAFVRKGGIIDSFDWRGSGS